jgi:hypothetical protein
MGEVALATPTKAFFLDMFTRDITLEDAVLDLVDNAIDALCRKRNIDLSVYYSNGTNADKTGINGSKGVNQKPATIEISFTDKEFRIVDTCGGIPYNMAKEEVFQFGRVTHRTGPGLSVYGVGLKRAIFKLGRIIKVESHTKEDGFVVHVDVDDWSSEEKKDDWTFPIERQAPATTEDNAGTSVIVSNLNREVIMRLNDGTLITNLKQMIASTYPLFLREYVFLSINDIPVAPLPMSTTAGEGVEPSSLKFEEDGVKVLITAGLAEKIGGEWNQDRAGWYVICNGRVVVWADKTDLTGWGSGGPQYQPKFRGFLGLVFFFSNNPETLPWTTTKRGLNKESRIYQIAIKKMVLVGRPVLDFLNELSQRTSEDLLEREVIDNLKPVPLIDVLRTENRAFTAPPRAATIDTVRVQFDASLEDIEKVRKCLKKPWMSGAAIGRHALKYFIEQECP